MLRRRADYTYVDCNLKWYRIWDTNGTSSSGVQYPNSYVGTQGATKESRILGGERNPDTATTVSLGSIFPHPGQDTGQWRHEEFIYKANSATNAADGEFHIRYVGPQGSLSGSTTAWRTDSTNAPGLVEQLSIQDDPSSCTPDGDVYYDDIYLDVTPSRVVMLDQSTYTSSSLTKKTPLIPLTWSDTQITAYFHQADFTEGGGAYISVCDSAGACSSGQLITVGAAAASVSGTSFRTTGTGQFKGTGVWK
jgi:hypothetical protein